jgi:hypothetical protein
VRDAILSADPAAAGAASTPSLDEIIPQLRKVITERRLAANRANAQKSTGPRSAEGKRRSSLNAVRYGTWAASSLLPGDNRAELAALATEFDLDFGAGGAVERQLATRVVAIAWKLRRLARAEEQMALDASHRYERARDRLATVTYEDVIVDPPDEPIGAQMLADDFVAGGAAGRMQQLLNAEVRLTGQLATVCRLLLKARESGGTRSHKSGPHTPLPFWPGGNEPIDGPPELDPSARWLRRELQLQKAEAAALKAEARNKASAAKTPEANGVPPAVATAESGTHHSDAERSRPSGTVARHSDVESVPAGDVALDCCTAPQTHSTLECRATAGTVARHSDVESVPAGDVALDFCAAPMTDSTLECRATAGPCKPPLTSGGWHPGNPRHPLYHGPQLTPLLRQRERDIAAARVKRRAMLEAALRGLSDQEEPQRHLRR